MRFSSARAIAAIAMAVTCLLCVGASSAFAGSYHWSYRKFFGGTDVNYNPNLVDWTAFCAYDQGRPWMLLPGPTVDGPGTFDSSYKAPGTFDIGIDGTNESTLDLLNRALNQNTDEVIQFVPAIQWPDGSWHFPTETDPAGQLQWMQAASHATPGAGSADSSWLFWRHLQWQAPAFDGFPGGEDVAPGYGSDWEFDSMFMDGGAGTYHVGGYIIWWPYANSNNGNGDFPGEYAFYVGDYDINTSGCLGSASAQGISAPQGTAGSGLSARTIPALIAKLQARTTVKNTRLHVALTRHTRARAGHLLKVMMFASTAYKRPLRRVIKSGTFTCRAKIGKYLGPRNHHHLLQPLKVKNMKALHRSRGANTCIYRLPKNSSGKHVAYAIKLRVPGIRGSATFADVHPIL